MQPQIRSHGGILKPCTHWHFDHADNNANFRSAGGTVHAHVNTKKRLSEPHELLGMHFEPVPTAALPSETFTDKHALRANGEQVALSYVPPVHTDIYVYFAQANVLHMGDLFFNGMYLFIDAGTGGNFDAAWGKGNDGPERLCRARLQHALILEQLRMAELATPDLHWTQVIVRLGRSRRTYGRSKMRAPRL
jgi:glyoxylase-like metal-dependent hydrolase (beta-lactamase superfamily II)